MTEPNSLHDDKELVEFFRELEGAGDGGEILKRYCETYPHLADEFRAMRATRQVLTLGSETAGNQPSLPGSFGDFRIKREIGRGGMGTIYEAEQGPFGRRVAVKTIRRDRHLSPSARERFLREQAVLARLHHTHIVPIHAGGQEGELQYFAMPYIDGASLQHVVRSASRHGATSPGSETPSLAELALVAAGMSRPHEVCESTEALPLKIETAAPPIATEAARNPKLLHSRKYLLSVARVMADAADALHHAHQAGVVHRDMKPSNIMVDLHEHCWVLDFGLAAGQAQGNGPGAGHDVVRAAASGILGTPRYMAPEQFHERADERTDVWGLGVTLYELLTLQPAFESRKQIESADPISPDRFVANLPRDLAAICAKALRKEPHRRYFTAKEFSDDLRRWLAHQPVQARRTFTLRRVGLWARRNKGWATAIAASFALLLTIAAGAIVVGQARAESAQMEVQAALTREKAERRARLIQNLIQIRLTSHKDRWTDRGWNLVGEAVHLGSGEDLQSQAAALLSGIDARPEKRFTRFGGYALAFDRAGGRLLMATTTPRQPIKADGVRLWDRATGRLDVLEEAGEGPVAFRPDDVPVQLATSVQDDGERILELRELAGMRGVTRFVVPGRLDDPAPSQITLSTDVTLAVAPYVSDAGGPALGVWDCSSGKLRRQFDGASTAVAFSSDGSLLARGEAGGRITVWSLSRGEQIASLRSGRNSIQSLAFAQDRRRSEAPERDGAGWGWLLASGDSGSAVIVWDLGSGSPRAFCHGSHHDVTALAFSPDGQTLASGGRGVRLWDLATGRPLLQLESADFNYQLSFSPDGRRLAVAGLGVFSGPRVEVWEIETHRGVQTLRGLRAEVSKFAFSPDGRFVAALSHDWQVAVWDREAGSLSHVFDAPEGIDAGNAALAFDADARRLAFATSGRAMVWDLQTGRLIHTWELPPSLLDALAFHPSGKLLLGRLETKNRLVGPLGNAPPREHPRVYRVRDLFSPNAVEQPLCEVRDVDWHGFVSRAPAGGRYFVVDGLGRHDDRPRRIVKVFDPITGKTLFESTPDAPFDYECIQIDPTGQILQLAEGPNEHRRFSLLEMPSGRWIRASEGGNCKLGPGARVWATGREPVPGEEGHGYALFETGSRHLVDLGIDTPSTLPTFHTDDRTFAWGTSEGTVYVADLTEVQRRLAAVGLGW